MKVISVEQMRELDMRTIQEFGTSGSVLMERAGIGSGKIILDYLKEIDFRHIKRFVLLAGKGNNGGDVYVIAKYLFEQCIDCTVTIYSICPLSDLKGDAKHHAEIIPDNISVEVKEKLCPDDFKKGDIIIDGLLGTGFKGKLRIPYDNWISVVNKSGLPVIAVDIPSGLNGDTGIVSEMAVKADLTITMAQPKKGLIVKHGVEYCGRIEVVDIGIPEEYVDSIENTIDLYCGKDAYSVINRTPANSHKKSLGSVLIIGGSKLYQGAPFLAGKAALRSGAGLVTVAVPKNAGILNAGIFSLITRRINDSGIGFFTKESTDEILNLVKSVDVVVVGPGISDNQSSLEMIESIMDLNMPVVFDADALNLIAKNPEILQKKPNFIFTPHPGEARRLANGFGLINFKNEDRISQAKSLQGALGGIVILKGHRTLVADKKEISINASGTPALATAGSGDVLTGILAANLALNLDLFTASCFSVYLHGLTGEITPHGIKGTIADDLIDLIPTAHKKISPFA